MEITAIKNNPLDKVFLVQGVILYVGTILQPILLDTV